MKYSIHDIPEIIVSCQSRPDQPFYNDVSVLKKMIDSVILGGAKGVRINGTELIKYTKEKHPSVFIIGTKKVISKSSPKFGWVTPDIKSAKEIITCKPHSIVVDASERLHTKDSLIEIIKKIRNNSPEILIGCDVGKFSEAKRAIDSGADFVLTTCTQAETRENQTQEKHIALLKRLVRNKIPTVAEGGIEQTKDIQIILSTGIRSVVIGKAITDPVFNTQKFVDYYKKNKIKILHDLYQKHFKQKPKRLNKLTPHASDRTYFLIEGNNTKAIGTIGDNIHENKTFIKFSKHLKKQGVSVPEVLIHDVSHTSYIQTFCGNKDLFSIIKNKKQTQHTKILKPAIDLLNDFQVKGTDGWDFNNCYPFKVFDSQGIKRDVFLFTEKFLKNIPINYSSVKLRKDIEKLIKELEDIPENQKSLMHRDFQSRNILVYKNKYILIDFQSARKGPIHYDLAALLYQSQANYSEETKQEILKYFISKKTNIDSELFKKHFYNIVVARILQALGSYGITGIEQKKDYFLKSIPFALINMKDVLNLLNKHYGIKYPEIESIINKITNYYDTHL
ncbi:MAG: phosphotransferase [Minisyncoccia bacterium]